MTTDITELAQREKFEAWAHSQKLSLAYGDCGYAFSSTEMAWRAWMASSPELVEALEKAHSARDEYEAGERSAAVKSVEQQDEIYRLNARIAELEREKEHLRPVGVMSETAFHRLENSECRFIALWPRPGIFLPRKRPEDGVIVYARTAATAGIKWEAE